VPRRSPCVARNSHAPHMRRLALVGVVLGALVLGSRPVLDAQQNCGGVERWAVKLAADPGGGVDRRSESFQAAPGYTLQTLNLTSYRGQTLRIELASTGDNGSMTSFVVDDVRIILVSPAYASR